MKRVKVLVWYLSFCIKWIYLREKGEKIIWINVYVVLFVIFEKWYEEDWIINFWYRLI